MTATETDNLGYRRCVGIMVLNEGGYVFVGQRFPREAEAWQMPQGGIDVGEDAREAAFRELNEETGIARVKILAETPNWLTYDFPPELIGRAFKGLYRGQTQKWFAMRFLGQEEDINLETHSPHEFIDWKWIPLDELPELVVDFKRSVYEAVIREFRHLANPQ